MGEVNSMQFGQTPLRDGMQFGYSNLCSFFWHAIRGASELGPEY
jgi:hypothetical protein